MCIYQHPSFLVEGLEMVFAVILMGSMSDRLFGEPITSTLDILGITYERRAASAHKRTLHARPATRIRGQWPGGAHNGAHAGDQTMDDATWRRRRW